MRVLITRPREDAESLVAELRAVGIETFVEPLLNIEGVAGAAAKLDKVQAILLTSRNGARALAEATDLRELPIYAVGDATAGAARELGFVNVESASGDSAALAALVEDRLDPGDGALLHGSGTAVAGDLAGALASKGFTVRCEVLYESRPATRLSTELQAHLTDGALDAATFFSPRTAQSFVNLVNDAGLARACHAVTAICISPAVARMLGSLEFSDIRVASRPDGPAMIAAIMDARARLDSVSETTATAEEDETTETEPETAIETPVPPEDNQTDPGTGNDGDQKPTLERGGEPTMSDTKIPPTMRNAKRGGGRKGTWFLLIALVIIGAGFVTFPKWKSHIPANFLPGGEVVKPAAKDRSLAAIAGLEIQIRRLRAETAGAISKAAKDVNTLEVQLVATETQLATTEAQSATLEKRLVAAQTAVNSPDSDARDQAAITQRIDGLEKRIGDIKTAQSNVESSTPTQAALHNRIKQLETAAETGNPAQRNAVEDSLKAENQRLSAALKSLNARLEEIGRQAAARASRLAAIEAATPRNASAESGIGSRDGALIVAVGQLRDALTRSTPFQDQLASMKAVAAGNAEVSAIVAPLTALARNGIPTPALLRQRFDNVAARATRVALVSRDTGWLDRTLAQLASVVTIRRVGDDVEGDTAQAILARTEARVLAGDLPGALGELTELTGTPAKSVASWRRDAEARLTADKAIAALTRIVIHRLAAPDDAAAK
jgi:uroporphyrinogen-III synthase